MLTDVEKAAIIRRIVESLRPAQEVKKIMIFGSFLASAEPRDVDVAVFQDSGESYLPLALKYRRMMRGATGSLPLDVVPLRVPAPDSSFLTLLEGGKVVYER